MNYVTPLDRKVLCQHRNGDNFATNPLTDFVPFMKGEVIEKLKITTQFEVYTIVSANLFLQIKAETVGTEIKVTHPYNSWNSEGFVVGNTVRIEANGAFVNETVTNIVGTEMYLTDTGPFFTALGVPDGDYRSDYVLKVTTPPTSLIFSFGIVPNSQVPNTFNSLLDGQEQVYSVDGVAASPTYTALNYLASNSSNLGSVQYTYDGASGTENYKFGFTTEHIFRVPHFIAEWLTDYINGTIPSVFAGSNSYRYVSQLNFCNDINNPNDGKLFTDDFQLGSIGFLNQNFNAGSTVYTLQDITYSIGGSEVAAPEATANTLVTAQIKKNDGNFTAGVKGYVYHSKLPEEADYSNNVNSYEDNFILDQIFETDGGGSSSGAIITGLTVAINGGDPSLLDITFNLVYPIEDQANILNGDWLLLAIAVEDAALTAITSDRTLVGLDVVQWTKDPDSTGLINTNQLWFTEVGSTIQRSSVKNWINQAYELDFSFNLAKFADSDDSNLIGLALKAVGYNTITDDIFIQEVYSFPFGKITSVDVDGTSYQQINIDTERFLSVPSGDSLREVQLNSVVPGAFSANQAFSGKVGFIIPWQEWIQNLNVPSLFYDAGLPDEFFNLNKRASNYSGVLDYDLYFILVARVEYQGGVTEYGMLSDKSQAADFDVDLAAAGWSATKNLYDDNDDLSDEIFNEDMRIEIIFAAPGAGALPIGDVMGTIVLEETGNTGRHWRLHTDLDYSEPDNPLEPLPTESFVKITQDVPGNTITLECRLDGSKLDPTKKYNYYGHLNDSR